ncbi:hypothetical protein [Motilibacter deserti]|uniref:PH (Pleckstrin Homology) domain-containing protein n=1 Tax=Motilibacter deserti TaxID=2714956 RepID=A0ABX0GV93_9ACTN|nr:hypothetical protein [Motilibacter deserti]
MQRQAGPAPGGREVHRAGLSRGVAVVWFVLAAVLLADTLVRGTGFQRLVVTEVLALITLSFYALAYRPALLQDDDGITLVNVVRDVRIPWPRIEHLGGKWSLEVRTDRGTFVAYASAPRKRRHLARDRVAEAAGVEEPRPRGGRSGEALTARLVQRWEERRDRAPAGEVVVRWRWDVIVPAVVLVGALVLTVALS